MKLIDFSLSSAYSLYDSVGINTNFRYQNTTYTNNRDTWVIPRLKELGINHVRDSGASANFFGHIAALPSNIKLCLTCEQRVGVSSLNALDVAMNYIGLSRIQYMEGANEWDADNQSYGGQNYPNSLNASQQALWNSIKGDGRSNGIPVLSPSFAQPEGAAGFNFSANCNIVNLHSYPGTEVPTNWLDSRWIPLMQATAPNKPLVVTETGYASLVGHSCYAPSKALGSYTLRLILENWKRGIERTYLFELYDGAYGDFGLIDGSNNPKASFKALRDFLTVIRSANATLPVGAKVNFALGGSISNLKAASTKFKECKQMLKILKQYRSTSSQLSVISGSLPETSSFPTDISSLCFQKENGNVLLILWKDLNSTNDQPHSQITIGMFNHQKAKVFVPSFKGAGSILETEDDLFSLLVADHPVVIEFMN